MIRSSNVWDSHRMRETWQVSHWPSRTPLTLKVWTHPLIPTFTILSFLLGFCSGWISATEQEWKVFTVKAAALFHYCYCTWDIQLAREMQPINIRVMLWSHATKLSVPCLFRLMQRHRGLHRQQRSRGIHPRVGWGRKVRHVHKVPAGAVLIIR